MDVQEIIKQLSSKFGNNFDISKVTDFLKNIDLKNLSFTDIVGKLHAQGLLNNVEEHLKGDALNSLKEKAGGMLGGLFK